MAGRSRLTIINCSSVSDAARTAMVQPFQELNFPGNSIIDFVNNSSMKEEATRGN